MPFIWLSHLTCKLVPVIIKSGPKCSFCVMIGTCSAKDMLSFLLQGLTWVLTASLVQSVQIS